MRTSTIPVLIVLLVSVADFAAASPIDAGGPHFLHINSGMEMEYNDNLFFTRRDQETDLITTGTLDLDAGYKTERAEFHLNPSWRFYKYLDESDLDDQDQIYRARLEYRLTPRFKFGSEGGYIVDNRREDQVVETGVVFENVERTRWEALVSAEYLPSEKVAVSVFGQYWNDDYEDQRLRSSFSDLEARGGGLGYTHLMSVFYRPTHFRMNGGYFNYDYDTAETDYYYLTVGASTELNEKYTLLAEAGPRYTDSDFDVARSESVSTPPFSRVVIDQESSSDWGSTWLLSLTYDGEMTNWEMALSRDITAASGETQTVEQTELKLDMKRHWSWELSTSLLMRYYYKESDRENSDIDDESEDTLVVQPRVRYRFNNDWFAQGTYRYTWRDDNEFDDSWDRNQVLIQIGHNWKIWE